MAPVLRRFFPALLSPLLSGEPTLSPTRGYPLRGYLGPKLPLARTGCRGLNGSRPASWKRGRRPGNQDAPAVRQRLGPRGRAIARWKGNDVRRTAHRSPAARAERVRSERATKSAESPCLDPTGDTLGTSLSRRCSGSGCASGTSLARLRPRMITSSRYDDSPDMSPRRHVDGGDSLAACSAQDRLVGRDSASLRRARSRFGSRCALLLADQRPAGTTPDLRG